MFYFCKIFIFAFKKITGPIHSIVVVFDYRYLNKDLYRCTMD